MDIIEEDAGYSKMQEKVARVTTNDGIAQVDCGRMPECCDEPHWINQIGSDDCICVDCRKRCNSCTRGDYLKRGD